MELTKETLVDISKITNLLTNEHIDEILFNQKVVQIARIAIKECPLGLCAYCAGLRLALGDEPWK